MLSCVCSLFYESALLNSPPPPIGWMNNGCKMLIPRVAATPQNGSTGSFEQARREGLDFHRWQSKSQQVDTIQCMSSIYFHLRVFESLKTRGFKREILSSQKPALLLCFSFPISGMRSLSLEEGRSGRSSLFSRGLTNPPTIMHS